MLFFVVSSLFFGCPSFCWKTTAKVRIDEANENQWEVDSSFLVVHEVRKSE